MAQIKPTELQQVKVGADAINNNMPIFEISSSDGKSKTTKKINAMNLEEARRIALDFNNITVVEVDRG